MQRNLTANSGRSNRTRIRYISSIEKRFLAQKGSIKSHRKVLRKLWRQQTTNKGANGHLFVVCCLQKLLRPRL